MRGLATRQRLSVMPGEARVGETHLHSSPSPFAFPFLHKRRKEAERRQTQVTNRRVLRRRAPSRARTPVGVPPRLSPKGIIPSQRLGFRPGFLGRGLNGRYPPSPVPVQGSTSHPGHNAGRHDAQAAREQRANPPAGTAPAPPFGLPPEGVLRESGINSYVIEAVTDVNRKATSSEASPARGRLAAQSAAGGEVDARSAYPHPRPGARPSPCRGEYEPASGTRVIFKSYRPCVRSRS